MKKQFIGGAAAIGVIASLILAAPAAHAEPVGDGYTVVGSDTLEIAMDLLANGTTASGAPVRVLALDGRTVDNFAAAPSGVNLAGGKIVAKPYGTPFLRPNGSGDGHRALSRSIDGTPWKDGSTITGQVDISRSSSTPSGANANGPIAAIPFGRDAAAYASNNAALNNLTTSQIEQLFECTLDVNSTINGVRVGDITPVIPQEGSGTRADFLAKHNISPVGACVATGQEHETRYIYTDKTGTSQIQRNDTTTQYKNEAGAVIGTGFPANMVTVMSTVQWILQKNIPAYNRIGSGFEIYSWVPTAPTPVDVVGGKYVPNNTFYASAAGRDTVLLVEYARINENDPKYDAVLADLLGEEKLGDVTTSFLPSDVMSAKQALGFGVPVSTTINRYNLRAN
ncbi:hypothetical protein [Microbacterium schleiferi]|uniref:PBP domain-containing protein n=1 Tax=Microbacterium schleiferi TaxID=69362 RepID=A0ABU7V872_9MICO